MEKCKYDKNKDEESRLLDLHKESSKSNHFLSVSFLLFLTYVAVAVLSVTDAQLLVQSGGVEMPLLGINIPLKWFFVFSPLIILAFYFNLVANLIEHAKKAKVLEIELKITEGEVASINFIPFYWDFAFFGKSKLFAIFHFFIIFALPLSTIGIIIYKYGRLQEPVILCAQIIFIVFLLILFLIYRARISYILGLKKLSLAFISYFVFSVLVLIFLVWYWVMTYGYVNKDSAVSRWMLAKKSNNIFPISSIVSLDISHNEQILLPQIDQWVAYNKSILGKETAGSLSSAFNDSSVFRTNLSGRSFNDIKMPYVFLPRANFSGSSLRYAMLQGGNFQGADFSNADLYNADLSDGLMGKSVNFEILELEDLYQGANLDGANFSNADLSGANLTGASAQAVDFSSTSLRGAKFHKSNLRFTDLFTDIRGVDFTYADIFAADFHGASGSSFGKGGLIFSVEETLTQGASFCNAKLQRANFQNVDLTGVNFCNAHLQIAHFNDAGLQGANFERANLQGADFTNADLRGADFSEAELQGADFTGADLRGAIFFSSNLYGAKISPKGPYLALELRDAGANWDDVRKIPKIDFFEDLINNAQEREKSIGRDNIDLIESDGDYLIFERWEKGLETIDCSDFCRERIAINVFKQKIDFVNEDGTKDVESNNKFYGTMLDIYDSWDRTMPEFIEKIEGNDGNHDIRNNLSGYIYD